MIIKLQTPTRQLRLQANPDDLLSVLIESKFNTKDYTCYFNNNKIGNCSLSLNALNITHGSLIKVEVQENTTKIQKEDDGLIYRKKDELMCTHDKNAMCSNCAPLDPWDKKYHAEKGIKYLSFNSYIKLLKKNNIPLEKFTVKKPQCKTHDSNTFCTICAPNVFTLQMQVYRMIDHIQINSRKMVDDVLNSYGKSGRQQFSLLVGDEQKYEMVPGGRKVVVVDVLQVEGEFFPDGFCVDLGDIERIVRSVGNTGDDSNDTNCDNDADSSGNKSNDNKNTTNDNKSTNNKSHENKNSNNNINDTVTDNITNNRIINNNNNKTNTANNIADEVESNFSAIKRNYVNAIIKVLKHKKLKIVGILYTNILKEPNPFILSPLEIEFIAKIQNLCMSNKKYNSKLITLVLSRNAEREIEINEYMVSEQCMGLIREEIIKPGREKFKSSMEIQYREKNEYGIETTINGNIIPGEYFIVKLTSGYYLEEKDRERFCWKWNLKKLAAYFDGDYSEEKFCVNALVRIYLEGFEIEKVGENMEFREFMESLVEKEWACGKCTFVNGGKAVQCEVCGSLK